jgi:hypothetical protein
MKNEKTYEVYYRQRGNKDSNVTYATLTCNNAKDARKDFEMWDNENKEWTVVKVIRVA